MKQNTKGIVEKTNKAKDDSLKDAPNTYTSGKRDKLQEQRGGETNNIRNEKGVLSIETVDCITRSK